MLGLGDASTAAALILCVAVTLFGVVYGIVNWNSGGPDDLFQHMGVNQEILAEPLLERELVFLQDLNGIPGISQICHISLRHCPIR